MNNDINSEKILAVLREECPYLEKEYKVKSLSLFGSYIKNKQTKQSDADILVSFNEAPGFIKFIKLENYLTEKLGIKADLVMKDALKKNIGNHIKKEAIPV